MREHSETLPLCGWTIVVISAVIAGILLGIALGRSVSRLDALRLEAEAAGIQNDYISADAASRIFMSERATEINSSIRRVQRERAIPLIGWRNSSKWDDLKPIIFKKETKNEKPRAN